MSKINVAISCPIDTYSGYGARARDFVKALDKSKYDVKILSQRWGNTRFGYLEDHNEKDLQSLIVQQLTAKPDVWIQVTVPNEFQAIGKYNIGVTAGIETTIADATWVQGVNRMDLTLVSSNHAKETFERSKFNVEDKGQITGTVQVQKPIEVLFEGADLEKYFKDDTPNVLDLSAVKESFAFLFVGHWLQGDVGHDRKNVGYMVKAFLETFKNKKKQPALILKTQFANASVMDREKIEKRIDTIRKTVKGTLPNIYVIHGEMSDSEINELYNHQKVKAMVNLTKGEGFGRPLLEFSLTGKPIIASAWSGHTDYLSEDFTYAVKGSLENVHPSAAVDKMILKEAQWFKPEDGDVANAFKSVFENYKKFAELGKRQAYRSRTEFSFEKMAELLDQILSKNLPAFPKQVELKLPKLELPKLNKL